MNGAIRIQTKDDLPAVIGDLRVMQQMRQVDLAEASGFRKSQVSTWLSGGRSMDVSSLIRVANALGYDLALILREDA